MVSFRQCIPWVTVRYRALYGLCLWAMALAIGTGIVVPASVSASGPGSDLAPGRTMAQQATKEKALWITSDHSQHDILQQDFESGPDVTKACLSCHNQAALQFHETIHWTWLDPATEASARLGKGGYSINNF